MPEPEGKAEPTATRFGPLSPSTRLPPFLRYRSGDGFATVTADGVGPMKGLVVGMTGRPIDNRLPTSIWGRVVGEVGWEED